jgi:beta-N-acetylhexosaminidase
MGELPGLSIGIGTQYPFELSGAPGLNATALVNELKRRRLPGFNFRAASWTPAKGRYAGQVCSGAQILITDQHRAQLTRLNFEIITASMRVAPHVKFFASSRHNAMFDAVCGTSQIRRMLQAKKSPDEIWRVWNSGAAAFKAQSAKYHLY